MNSTQIPVNERPKILVVAALARELTSLRKRNLQDVTLLTIGVGRKNAERRLRAWFSEHQADAVICLGLAGALSPALGVADLVVDKTEWPVGDSLNELPPLAIHFGKIITIDEIVGAQGKREMAARLAPAQIACVEMESAAVAEVCREHGLACLLVRAISDRFNEDFPVDFNRCRDEHGDLSQAKVMQAVLRRPQAIKPLIDLSRRANLCAERLAAFVELALPTIHQALLMARKDIKI